MEECKFHPNNNKVIKTKEKDGSMSLIEVSLSFKLIIDIYYTHYKDQHFSIDLRLSKKLLCSLQDTSSQVFSKCSDVNFHVKFKCTFLSEWLSINSSYIIIIFFILFLLHLSEVNWVLLFS